MFPRKVFILVVLLALIIFASAITVSAESYLKNYNPSESGRISSGGNNIRWPDVSHVGGVWENYGQPSVYAIAVDKNNVKWLVKGYSIVSFYGGNYTKYKFENVYVQSIAVDHDNVKWFGTMDNGIFSFDGVVWKNHGLDAGEQVLSIAVDHDNVKWFGTNDGVYSFDGVVWRHYTAVDGLGSDYVNAIAVDKNNVKWFGTAGAGVSSFDGVIWRHYTAVDGLGSDYVNAIAVDKNNVKWFGTAGAGVSSFDGVIWKTYTSKDGLVDNSLSSIAVDKNNVKWFGTWLHGASSFDGAVWETYTIKNGLGSNDVRSIVVDVNNIKWFGAWSNVYGGLSSYGDGTLTSVEEPEEVPRSIEIRGNFPNPFNPTTTIEFSIGHESLITLAIYNLAGQKVRTLIDGERLTAGVQSVVWDGKDEAGKAVSSGVYFCRVIAGNLTSVSKMTLIR